MIVCMTINLLYFKIICLGLSWLKSAILKNKGQHISNTNRRWSGSARPQCLHHCIGMCCIHVGTLKNKMRNDANSSFVFHQWSLISTVGNFVCCWCCRCCCHRRRRCCCCCCCCCCWRSNGAFVPMSSFWWRSWFHQRIDLLARPSLVSRFLLLSHLRIYFHCLSILDGDGHQESGTLETGKVRCMMMR